jgi:DNA-binding Xre family transcriptional regulator
MKRIVGYTWRLRELMATRGKFTATELVPLLHERDINLSASQVRRLVSGTPERLSLQVLSAVCDILGCTPADLVTTVLESVATDLQRRGIPLKTQQCSGCGYIRKTNRKSQSRFACGFRWQRCCGCGIAELGRVKSAAPPTATRRSRILGVRVDIALARHAA